MQGSVLRRHGLEKAEHHKHKGSHVHPLGLRALGVLAQFCQLEDSGLVHLWGLTADQSTLCRRVRVDILGHSS
jgi:hypothetical protein